MTGRPRRRDRATVATAGPEPPAGSPPPRRPIAFALHQVLEYLLALVLVVASVHIGHSVLLLAAGAVFGLLALTAQGPLGLLRVCGRHFHHILDVSAAVVLALAPLVRALRPGVVGLVVVELVAVGWWRVTTLTRYATQSDAAGPRGAVDSAAAAMQAGAAGVGPADRGRADAGPVQPGPALRAIHRLGRLTAGARGRLPDARTTLDAGARRVGGQAGRLHRAWRRAAR